MSLLTTLASRFVAGETAEEAMHAVRSLNEQRAHATLNFLGEETKTRAGAERARDEYIHLLKRLAAAEVDGNVSVKLSQLGLALDERLCQDNVVSILKEAAKSGNFVRLDMEGSEYTQRTLHLFKGLQAEHANCGVVIQAAMLRSAEDIKDLNRRGARVRLCKGAYKEPPGKAVQSREEVSERYDRMAEELLLHGVYPAFATHDDERIAHIQAFASENKIGKDKFEFQMLYGLRPKLWHKLLADGYRVRIYVPYGTHCVGYLWRRLRERKENLMFVVKNLWE